MIQGGLHLRCSFAELFFPLPMRSYLVLRNGGVSPALGLCGAPCKTLKNPF
jgi:hypothetical protein